MIEIDHEQRDVLYAFLETPAVALGPLFLERLIERRRDVVAAVLVFAALVLPLALFVSLPKNVLALAGPYTFKQGDYDVAVVSDGTLQLPVSLVGQDAKPEDVKALLGAMVQGDNVQFEASPLLLRSGSEVILMDTGSGGNFQPTAGKIAESLKAAGVEASLDQLRTAQT